jgi:hypothetical protein
MTVQEQPTPPTEPSRSTMRKTPLGALLWAAGIFILVLIIWFNIPAINPWVERVASLSYSPTPTITVTSTFLPTRTPTPPPTETLTPLPSQTPMPSSAYFVDRLDRIDPPIRGAGSGYVMNDDKAVTAIPDFTSIQWIPSSKIGDQLQSIISEPYHATFGAASVTWAMDVPIPAGIYELFVMDTVYSSAGSLDFTVTLDNQPIQPIFKTTSIDFLSSRGEPPQVTDLWHSLGFYQLDHPGMLAVSTQWGTRDERSIMAVDRVVVAAYPPSTQQLIGPLPKDRFIFLVDDQAADIQASQVLFPENDDLAWMDQYQFVDNPEKDIIAKWSPRDVVPIGTYEVAVWLPKKHSTGEVTYSLTVNNEEVPNDQTRGPVTISEAGSAGQWVSLGTWTTPHVYEKPVQLTLKMQVKGGSTGEFSFDVVAFLKTP